ncbi:MAG: hypothetical protein LBP24_04640 [Coriobacteriales bacterium]|jgi:hypothetical protein|nr:hypothetical protein [Coriobacteriales bacterium]
MATQDSCGSSPELYYHQPLDQAGVLTFADKQHYKYQYELLKRAGWRSRRVESIAYVDFGRWQHKASFNLSLDELKKRRDEFFGNVFGESSLPLHFPLCALEKKQILDSFDAKDACGNSLQLAQRIESNAFALDALLGCIIKYQEEQVKYRKKQAKHQAEQPQSEQTDSCNQSYSLLYPDALITLPSLRMLKVFATFIESDDEFESAEDVIGRVSRIFKIVRLTEDEQGSWDSLREIFEFRYLLFHFVRHWIPCLKIDPIEYHDHLIIKVRYILKRNLCNDDSSGGLIRLSRILLSLAVGLLFCLPLLCANPDTVFSLPRTFWVPGIIGFSFLLSFVAYALVSRDLVLGWYFFQGVSFREIPLRIGDAETEHITIEAPAGTVFTPIPKRFKEQRKQGNPKHKKRKFTKVVVYDLKYLGLAQSRQEYAPHATATASLTPNSASMRTRKQWNFKDPWIVDTADMGHHYRSIPYAASDSHVYHFGTWLRPKIGRRGFGYMVAPLITLVAFFLMNIIMSASGEIPLFHPVENLSSISTLLVMLAPLTSALITSTEDETFMLGVLMQLPRACWTISIFIAAYGFLVETCFPGAWAGFYGLSAWVLAALSLVTLSWFLYHRFKDVWVQKDDCFNRFDVLFVPVDPIADKPYSKFSFSDTRDSWTPSHTN